VSRKEDFLEVEALEQGVPWRWGNIGMKTDRSSRRTCSGREGTRQVGEHGGIRDKGEGWRWRAGTHRLALGPRRESQEEAPLWLREQGRL
jgi:hypothetical protein